MLESDFDNIISKKDKVQDLKFNQLGLEVQGTYEKEEKTKTNLQAVIDVINEAYLDEKFFKKKYSHIINRKD